MKKTIVCLVAFGLIYCSSKNKEVVQYDYFKVEQKNLVQSIETNGSIEVDNEAQITAPVNGRLEKLFIEEGQEVTKGQRIGYMSSDARIRVLDMAAHKGPEEIVYWREQILPTYIFSPVSGKVIDIRLRPGDDVRGYIARISRGLVIRANVDEVDIQHIKLNQKVFLRFDISDQEVFTGTLTRIAMTSKSVSNVNVYPVEVSLPSKEQIKTFDAKIGMSVSLEFPTQEIPEALSVKATAVNNRSNEVVTVTLKSGEKQKVELGSIYETDVHIISGLELGDEIQVPRFKNMGGKKSKSPLSFFGK